MKSKTLSKIIISVSVVEEISFVISRVAGVSKREYKQSKRGKWVSMPTVTYLTPHICEIEKNLLCRTLFT